MGCRHSVAAGRSVLHVAALAALRGGASRAFSLIEILIVISILSILLALTVPSLVNARGQGRQVGCMSNLKGIATVIELYTQASRDRYPYTPADTWIVTSPPEDPPASAGLDTQHFAKLRYNWTALVGGVAPWRQFFATWVCSGARRPTDEPWRAGSYGTGDGASSYIYSSAFRARPEVWSPGATADPALLAAVAVGDVAFPARKVMFFDGEMAHLPPNADKDNRPMLFADGHAALHRVSQAAKPVVNPFTKLAEPLHDTALGVRGFDY